MSNMQKRRQQRELRKEQHTFVSELPEALTPIPPEDFPAMKPLPVKAWKSRKYLVQLYFEQTIPTRALMRLSVCRAKLGGNGRWTDGITWDELQAIKREVGYGDWYGVEVYPRDKDVVNVANIRHLWLMAEPLPIGWFPGN